MSRSSTDALAIGLGTCEIAIGRRRPAWPKRAAPEVPPSEVRTVAIESARRYTEAGLLDALSRALDDASDLAAGDGRPVTGLPTRRRASVVLDDFWGRHAILRGDFRRMRARDLDEVAGAYFADTFGVDGETLAVRWQTQPGGRTLFASALPCALVDAIRERGAERQVEVTSLMLALPQRLNRARSAITARDGWLFVATDTLLHAVAIGDGAWSAYDAERLFRRLSDDGDCVGRADSDCDAESDADADAHAVADAARQIVERSAQSRGGDGDIYLCGLALDCEPFERSFSHFVSLSAHMSSASPAVGLMELAS